MRRGKDPFDSGAFGATKQAAKDKQATKKGHFELPNNAVDLIGMMLDPDIRKARNNLHSQIENGNAGIGRPLGGTGNMQNTPMTQAAQTFSKAIVSIQAINKQAQRNRRRR
jgi:hypothetical protein